MRRLDADLRDIVDLQTAALVRGRLDARGCIFQNVVEHAGGDAHAVLVGDRDDHVEQLVHALAGERGDEHDGRVGHIAEIPADLGRLLVHGVRVLLDRVPLVDDDDAGLPCLMCQTCDLGILLGDTLIGVDQDEAHVRALDGGDGAQVRILLDCIVDLRLAAHTGRIDKEELAGLVFKVAVDGVARGARDVGDDHALFAEDLVEQARLADIRLADDGDLDDVLVVFLAVIGREAGDAGVEQIARAVAMDRGDLNRVAEAEGIEFIRFGVGVAGLVALVDSQHDRLLRALEHGRDLRVRGGQADRHVDDHDDDRRRLNGDLRLTAHKFQHFIVRARLDAAGIDERKAAPVPLAFAVDPVTGDARRILHDRHALAGQLIEEHRFADVRPADDGYDRF